MDFEKVLNMRQSTRKFQEKQITEEQLEKILNAANRAPIGSNKYEDIHITVVQNKEILLKLCEAAWERFSRLQKLEDIAGDTIDKTVPKEKKNNLFYGAPTVIFVSHKNQDLQPGIEWANATSVINQMHLETINLGLASVYMWGALESMRMIPELDNTSVLNLPNEYEPLIALAVGYPVKELEELPIKHEIIKMNKI
ncbi:MAG: nitroreductase family protein [Lachnospiraceae bacterium]|nr:nitroreductase family protein [Lachnospiraceae bacterium]